MERLTVKNKYEYEWSESAIENYKNGEIGEWCRWIIGRVEDRGVSVKNLSKVIDELLDKCGSEVLEEWVDGN